MNKILIVIKIVSAVILLFSAQAFSQNNYKIKWTEENDSNRVGVLTNNNSVFLTIKRNIERQKDTVLLYSLRDLDKNTLWNKTLILSKTPPSWSWSYQFSISSSNSNRIAVAHSWYSGTMTEQQHEFLAFDMEGNTNLNYSRSTIKANWIWGSVYYNPNGTELFTKLNDGEIKCWKVNSGNYSEKWKTDLGSEIVSIHFSPDNQPFVIVLISNTNEDGEQLSSTITRLNTDNGETEWSTNTNKIANSIAINLDGSVVSVGTQEGKVIEYNSQTGNELRVLNVADDNVYSLKYISDDKLITDDYSFTGFKVWDAVTGNFLWSPEINRAYRVSKDGGRILVYSGDQYIEIRNSSTGDIIWTGDQGSDNIVTSAGFSANDQYIITAGEGFISVWEQVITDVADDLEGIPKEFNLAQNYPNPFNPTTLIRFSVPNSQFVAIKVYDILGNEVATLVNEQKPPGDYKVNFNASNLSSGVYFYRIKTGKFNQVKKMLLLR